MGSKLQVTYLTLPALAEPSTAASLGLYKQEGEAGSGGRSQIQAVISEMVELSIRQMSAASISF